MSSFLNNFFAKVGHIQKIRGRVKPLMIREVVMKISKKNPNTKIVFWKRSFWLVAVLSQAVFCFSNEDYENKVEVVTPNSRLQIGGTYAYLNLKPQSHPAFHGNLGGVEALYEYRPLDAFYGGVKFNWRQGHTHGTEGTRSIHYYDVQERLGYTVACSTKNWLLTLFSGFGYHYTGQKLTAPDNSSVHFGYNEFYVPVGLMTSYQIVSCFSLGLDFTWMPEVFPTVEIIPLKGTNWALSYILSNFYVALPFTFTLTKDKCCLFTFKPFYELWKDGHSTAVLSTGTPLGLPGNTYNYYGADVSFGFAF